jgi:hypothetical protein
MFGKFPVENVILLTSVLRKRRVSMSAMKGTSMWSIASPTAPEYTDFRTKLEYGGDPLALETVTKTTCLLGESQSPVTKL